MTQPSNEFRQPETNADLRWFLSIAATTWGLGRRLRRAIGDILAAESLSDDEFLALALLSNQPAGISQVELADELGISTAQTSGLVERLKNRGWLHSARDSRDRRRQLWQLAEAGCLQLEKCRQRLEPLTATLRSALPAAANLPSDLQQLLTRLNKFAAAQSNAEAAARRVA